MGARPAAGTPVRESKRVRLLSRLRQSPLLRSAGLRFAALYAIIFGLSALALAIFLWWATAGLLNRQVEAAINADAQGLGERYQEGGIPALILTIQDRLSQSVDENAIYLLVDSDLHPIAGNLSIAGRRKSRPPTAGSSLRSSAATTRRSPGCIATTCRAASTSSSAATWARGPSYVRC